MSITNIYTDSSFSTQELQALVNSAAAGTVIHLDAGTYVFTQTLVINKSGVQIKGAGSDATSIVAAETMESQPVFQVGHSVFNPNILNSFELLEFAGVGSREILLASDHGLKPGDYIYVTQQNSDALFAEIGDSLWQKDAPLRTVLVEIAEVDGGTITLKRDLPYNFDPEITTVEHRSILEGNSLSGFSVEGSWGETDPSAFKNSLNTENGATAILVAGTSGAQLTDLKVIDPASHGITIANSTNLDMRTVTIDGSHDKGGGGNGYAIWLRDVYDSSLSDLTLLDTRHAVVFASYTSAVGNTIHVSHTNRDINFHGGLDQDNTVQVDHSIRTAIEQGYMSPSLFFNNGTTYGAPTDKVSNDVTFSTVIGTVRSDEVTSAQSGSVINMKGGNDITITNDGNDYVDMGTGADITYASEGIDFIDGNSGYDKVVFQKPHKNYSMSWDEEVLIVQDGDNISRLTRVEIVAFEDTSFDFLEITPQTAEETAPTLDNEVAPAVEPSREQSFEPEPNKETLAPTAEKIEVAPPVASLTSEIEPSAPAFQEELVLPPIWEPTGDQNYKKIDGDQNWERATSSESTLMGERLDGLSLESTDDLTVIGNDLDNNILGNSGNDRFEAGLGNDRVFGRGGDDAILGGTGDDFLFGQSGDDILIGGEGFDFLRGGRGADVFVGTKGTNIVDDFDFKQGDSVKIQTDVDGTFDSAFAWFLLTNESTENFVFEFSEDHLSIHYDEGSELILLNTSIDDFTL